MNDKIAILIVGQLRFETIEKINIFKDKIKKYDIFISTYKEYENIANCLSNNVLFLEDVVPCNGGKKTADHKYDKPINRKGSPGRMYQHLHIEYLINTYKETLLKYDVIYRIRTDILFDKKIFNTQMKDNTIYLFNDLLFAGKSAHFINVFEIFYNKILTDYYGNMDGYYPIKFTNLLNIQTPSFRWNWLVYPKFLQPSGGLRKLQNNIKTNLDALKTYNQKVSAFPIGTPNFNNNFTKGNWLDVPFSSEKIVLTHCINCGFIDGFKEKVSLERNRFKFANNKHSI